MNRPEPDVRRVVVVHGYDAAPDQHWFPWLRDRLTAEGVRTVAWLEVRRLMRARRWLVAWLVWTVLLTGLFIVLFVIVVGFFYVSPENYTPFVPASQPAAASGGWAEQPFLSFLSGASPAAFGFTGIISGAALVFFAFIGFDVVATSAEEVKNPSRTLPRGIFAGLAVVSVLYILVTLVTDVAQAWVNPRVKLE